jgi:cystathionine beta-lyase
LQQREEIKQVFCPALPTDPNHAHWLRDCHGTNGLLTIEFARIHTQKKIEQMIDALRLFGLGASWGGFESLVIPANMQNARSLTDWSQRGQVVRLHIGLEDPEDLIQDLTQAFEQLHL